VSGPRPLFGIGGNCGALHAGTVPYAGIGSRGRRLSAPGFVLRSGGARGANQAFERGAVPP